MLLYYKSDAEVHRLISLQVAVPSVTWTQDPLLTSTLAVRGVTNDLKTTCARRYLD